MDNVKEKTWIQCLNCGHIYIVEQKIPFDISIVKAICPRCEHGKGLHCGYNEMDVMELKDPYLTNDYFDYSTK